ncbi:hypothetical protein CWI36_0150p0060 [Hamiltosporidium magnivora]|uniref:Uncharacterized protein n=1 Tax=Hamiltosporidium magnivora TaxID=148818 RepID=A0A4Q9LJZ6_9MICR|nr:hypothetical protein CWI36_0150p0060 [Hamiltosporidium magnivora]
MKKVVLKQKIKKNIIPFIIQGGTTLEEPINNIKGRVVFGRRDSSGERGRIKHIKMGKKILTKNFIHGLLYYYIDCNNYDIDRKIIN